MLTVFRPTLICCLAVVSTSLIHGQTLTPPAGNDGWQRLKQSERDVSQLSSQNGKVAVAWSSEFGAPAVSSPAGQAIAAYLSRADELKAFRVGHAGDARASEAQRLEAVMLVNAAYYGDSSAKKRRDDLVALVRADQSVSAEDRFSLATLADYQPLRFQSFASDATRLAQFEQTARALIAEFPGTASAYESLLSFAKDCPEAQSAHIAGDLLRMPASTSVKREAQAILDRQFLIGQSLKTLLASALAAKDRPTLATNKITILYPWTSGDEGSLVIAAEIAAKAPLGATIVGVNLDTDTAAARKVATARALPGVQLYDPAGPNSSLARGLKLVGDNIAFVTNRQGLIVAVSARPDLSPKISTAAQ